MAKGSPRQAVAYSGGTDPSGVTVARIHYDDGTIEESRHRLRLGPLIILPRPDR